jgi:hypothetical protein
MSQGIQYPCTICDKGCHIPPDGFYNRTHNISSPNINELIYSYNKWIKKVLLNKQKKEQVKKLFSP